MCDVRRFYSGHGQKIALQVTCDDSWCVPAVHALLYLRTMHCGGVTTSPPLRSPMLLLLSPKGAIGRIGGDPRMMASEMQRGRG